MYLFFAFTSYIILITHYLYVTNRDTAKKKSFYNSIVTYHKMVTAYSDNWKVPYCIYTILVNGFVLFLVPTAALIIGNDGDVKLTIVNMMIYVLVTPLFSQCVMRSMYLSNATNQAGIAVDRINDIARTKDLEVCENPVPMQKFDVEFRNVNFTYPDTDKQVLKERADALAEY